MARREDLSTEVLVVGAGASGIPAAIGAARAGAEVILIDEDPVIGGAPCDFYVAMFCGGPITGVLAEAADLLQARYSLLPGASTCLWYLPESHMRAYHRLLASEKRIRIVTGARAVGVLKAGPAARPRVAGVRVEAAGRSRLNVASKITIDATGTGAVARLAGCKAMYGRDSRAQFGEPHAQPRADHQVQQCTWMYISQQIKPGKAFDMMKLEHVKLGVLVVGANSWFSNDPEQALRVNPGIYLHWGCAVTCSDTRDPIALARAQQEAFGRMERDHALLRENGYAVHLAPRIGVRESSRIVGEHVITENDLRSGRLPEDTIAVGSYPLDIWGDDFGGAGAAALQYGIPYRALVPRGVDGLLLAGKAISGTHRAMSAYRVMPIVAGIGQAAGVAAALCVRHRWQPRRADPVAIRRTLRGKRQHLQLSFAG